MTVVTVISGYSEQCLQLTVGLVNSGCSQHQMPLAAGSGYSEQWLQLAAALVGGISICRLDWQRLQLAGAQVQSLCTAAGGFGCLSQW